MNRSEKWLLPRAAALFAALILQGLGARRLRAELNDGGIADTVKAALALDPRLGADAITVGVIDGNVVLSGAVDSLMDKERAASAARGVDGGRTANRRNP